ncbi:MAG TPA: hypothetical protein VMY34_07830 [Acidimicrobiales bacterium]|nr:hypothetical protein [Acidimicrobiales bacterium]
MSTNIERGVWIGTSVFAMASVLAVVVEALRPTSAVIDLALFAMGCLAFAAAYLRAVARSRTEEIGVASLFFLTGGVAPVRVQRSFMAALATQVVVAFAAASLRPFTPLAFGVLVPVFGLGSAGLWGARFAVFASRPEVRGRAPRPGR